MGARGAQSHNLPDPQVLIEELSSNGTPIWRDINGNRVTWSPTDWEHFPTQLLDYNGSYLRSLQAAIVALQDIFGKATLEAFSSVVKQERTPEPDCSVFDPG